MTVRLKSERVRPGRPNPELVNLEWNGRKWKNGRTWRTTSTKGKPDTRILDGGRIGNPRPETPSDAEICLAVAPKKINSNIVYQ